MGRAPRIFHGLSYLQYPLVLVAVFYAFQASQVPVAERFGAYNSALVFMGLSVSMSTLQDTSTTQNEVSRKVWSSPVAGKCFLLFLAAATAGFITLGLWGMYQARDHKVNQVSFGLLVLGIGFIGLLKAAGEMFEHHRSDRP